MLMIVACGFALLLAVSADTCGPDELNHKPHIIFILADDMGWNDVSFHGSPQIPTPNIDALAASGIVLHNFYASPQCTPSRASLMTGRYPCNTGLQHIVIVAGEATGLPLNFTLFPQHFKNLGYETHLVGKWHLGCHMSNYTPPYRGFDSFFGLWNGEIDYYVYTHCANQVMCGLDLHDGMKIVSHLVPKYATEIFTERAINIIKSHKTSKPLLLSFFPTAPHVGNFYQPLQVPKEYVKRFWYIKDVNRRIYAGQVAALDDAIGKIVEALDNRRMLQNSIIVFMSDNGGEVAGRRGGWSSNYPLRGAKVTLWEGGCRSPAIIWSPILKLKKPKILKNLMYVSDWLPTLYRAAGGDVHDLGDIDGINMWDHIYKYKPPPREELPLNIDQIYGMSALIRDNYKVINGTHPERIDSWYGPTGREDINVTSMDEWVWKNGSIVKEILKKHYRWPLKEPDTWREGLTVNCEPPPDGNGGCDPTVAPCLFDIAKDPCEKQNIASEQPEILQDMMNRIFEIQSRSMQPLNKPADPNADPRCHGYEYVPWLDAKHRSEGPCPSSVGSINQKYKS